MNIENCGGTPSGGDSRTVGEGKGCISKKGKSIDEDIGGDQELE